MSINFRGADLTMTNHKKRYMKMTEHIAGLEFARPRK